MHKTLRRLPSLDFLKGFEAAGRLLSFTRAAQELFVTQSALSRQVQALEDALGVAAVRAPASRARADAGGDRVPPRRDRRTLRRAGGGRRMRHAARRTPRAHAVDDRLVRVAVDDSAAAGVPRPPSGRRGLRFRRRPPRRPRRAATSTSRSAICPDARAPEGAVRLFGERMLPVVEPEARARAAARRSRSPPTSRGTCCCISTIPTAARRGSTGASGSPRTAQPGLKPAGSLRFKLYDQVIQAAVGGQGVALGRVPLIAEHLRDGRLVAPFPKRYDSARGYYAVVAPHAARARRRRAASSRWLRDEAARRARARRVARRAAHRARAQNATRRSRRDAASADDATRNRISSHAHGAAARAVAVDRALRASRRPPARASSISPAATAATRASSPPAAAAWSPSIATRRRSRHSPARPASRRARSISRPARWPLAGERFDAIVVTNYLHRPLFPSLLAALGGRRRAALRDLRPRQRGVRPAVESGLPARARRVAAARVDAG